jgi:hypothetical protein
MSTADRLIEVLMAMSGASRPVLARFGLLEVIDDGLGARRDPTARSPLERIALVADSLHVCPSSIVPWTRWTVRFDESWR